MPSAPTDKLFIESQFPINHRNLSAVLAPYGIRDFKFSLAGSGVENATIIVETKQSKHALRVYRQAKKTTGEIETELAFMEYLGSRGIPVPRVTPTAKGHKCTEVPVAGRTWQVVLMEFCEGHHPEGYTDYLLDKMAQIQAGMHLLGAEFAASLRKVPSGRVVLKAAPLIASIDPGTLPDPRLAALLSRAKGYRTVLPADLQRGFSHFDFVDGNLLVARNGRISAVLDFDDARLDPLIICLANTLWSIITDTEGYDAVSSYAKTYQRARRLSPGELASVQGLLLHRHYWIWAMIVSFGNTDPAEMERYLSMEKKIQELPHLL